MTPVPNDGVSPQPATTIDDLKAQLIWLLWRSEPASDPTKKARKVPYYVGGGRREGALDSPEDRARLVTYEKAAERYNSLHEAYSGLAFATGPDGRGGHWQVIDLDQIEQNGLSDIANRWVRGDCAGWGYVEVSPSKGGAHIVGYGRAFQPLGPNATGIEAYCGGRFFTFTGEGAANGSPCRAVDLAGFVEQVLVARHATARVKAEGDSEAVWVGADTVAELRSALLHMRSDDRGLWVAMGHALKTLGEIGRGLWMTWSSASEKFDLRDADRTWDSFTPRATGHEAVFAEAMRQGWPNPRDSVAVRHGGEVAADLMRNARSGSGSSGAAAPARDARRLVSRSLGGVAARAVDWLWTGWIPKGYITIFAGESGAGKSTVLADIAARVTTGRPWPGEPEGASRAPARVLWLGSEDGIEEMTVPRLLACGANLNNVIEIQGVSHEGRRSTFSMQDDIEEVERTLAWARDDGLPFAMLVIDPVTSYLPGQKLRKVDLNDAGQLRSILEPWLPLAQRHNIAVVCVTHFGKDTTRSMLHRVLGSAAFAQTCRSLCAVVEPPATEDYEPGPFEKALMQVKVNLPEHPGGAWRFSTEKVEVGTDPRTGAAIAATKPSWEALDGALTTKTAVGKRRGPKSQQAAPFALWLQLQFTAHPPGTWLPSELIKMTAIRDCGVSESWWNKHSRDFMERQNLNGTWMCRPVLAA